VHPVRDGDREAGDDAVYGYWSAVTSTPSARARSINAVDSFTLPQFFCPEAL